MVPAPTARVSPPPRVCLGVIVGAHGVRGEVKVKAFTADPLSIGSYGLLGDERGSRSFVLTARAKAGQHVIARIEGVSDRDAADELKGTRLYVDRDALPPPAEDEYYHVDLIGLDVAEASGKVVGRIVAVQDFGAGDVIEIACPDGTHAMVPFTAEAVPEVELAARRVVLGGTLSAVAAR